MQGFSRFLGCLTAAVIVFVPAPILLFALGWGGAHCEPFPECRRSAELTALLNFLPILATAVLVGWGVAWVLGRMAARRGDEEGGSALFVLIAVVMTILAVSGALLLVFWWLGSGMVLT